MKKFFLSCFLFFCFIALGRADTLAPFKLDFSQAGGPSGVTGKVIASGLNFAYGLSQGPAGSLLFGQTTPNPTNPYGVIYGWGFDSVGSAWMIPKLGDGGFGPPTLVINGLEGVVTSTQGLSNGDVLVGSGSGAAGTPGSGGTRKMSVVDPITHSIISSVSYNYPAADYTNCEHCNEFDVASVNPDGSYRVRFITGSIGDSTPPQTITMNGFGHSNVPIQTNSIYQMDVTISGNIVTATTPVKIGEGMRNPVAIAIAANNDLYIGTNGQDGPVVNGQEFAADTLNVIPSDMVGLVVPNFGYPDAYVNMQTGEEVNYAGYTPPVVAFRGMVDSAGNPQISEGISGMVYVPPAWLPFVGSKGGLIIGFYGQDTADNTHGATLFHDLETKKLITIVAAGNPKVDHIVNMVVDGYNLYLLEMVAGSSNDSANIETARITQFNLSNYAVSTPEPSTIWLGLVGVGLPAFGRKRKN